MKIGILGGAGFIGCNVAEYYAKKDSTIIIFDNLSRKGSSTNLSYLQEKYPGKILFIHGDIRNYYDLIPFFKNDLDFVFHFAAQVAVTTSIKNPLEDFEINVKGTLNILEAMRIFNSKAILLYSSTNKVYGGMENISITKELNKYAYKDLPMGISEKQQLDFHSPYGCSKGSAEQYVRDYTRIYGLRTVVFRQSCIYGYRQFGIEDQGWVAWFTIAAAFGLPLTIYGDGKQVRDVLFIDDLVKAYDLAIKNIEKTNGKIYNVGGGSFQLSILELLSILEKLKAEAVQVEYEDWRPGDQLVYVSDIKKAKEDFGWEPQISVTEGMQLLYKWVLENKKLFQKVGLIK